MSFHLFITKPNTVGYFLTLSAYYLNPNSTWLSEFVTIFPFNKRFQRKPKICFWHWTTHFLFYFWFIPCICMLNRHKQWHSKHKTEFQGKKYIKIWTIESNKFIIIHLNIVKPLRKNKNYKISTRYFIITPFWFCVSVCVFRILTMKIWRELWMSWWIK